jgi:hypothetical protein
MDVKLPVRLDPEVITGKALGQIPFSGGNISQK